MKHFDENTLELYLLECKLVENEKEAISSHLKECFSCNELYVQIKQFHNAFEGRTDLLNATNKESLKSSIVLKPSYSPVHRYPDGGMIQISLPAKFWFYVSHNPYKSAFFAVSFAFIVLMGFNINSLFKDTTPDHLITNDSTKTISIFNKENKILWSTNWNKLSNIENVESDLNISFSKITDIDEDGTNEIISVIPNLFNSIKKDDYLTIINSNKTIRLEKKLGRSITYKTRVYDDNFTARGLIVDKFNSKDKEIIVGIKHRNSPYAIIRLDNYGNVLGEYWHCGHFWGIHEIDLNNDSKMEILLCGINDAIEGEEKAVLSILDPSKIIGKTKSPETIGFGFTPSKAEIAYIEFPYSELDRITKFKPRITKLIDEDEKNFTVFLQIHEEILPNGNLSLMGFDITFNKDLTIKEVRYTDATSILIKKLIQEGKISKNFIDDFGGIINKKTVNVVNK